MSIDFALEALKCFSRKTDSHVVHLPFSVVADLKKQAQGGGESWLLNERAECSFMRRRRVVGGTSPPGSAARTPSRNVVSHHSCTPDIPRALRLHGRGAIRAGIPDI
jgi:hypothetical protein